MGDPSGQDETVAATLEGRGEIVGDLCVAGLVQGQEAVHLGERTRRVQVHLVGAERGLVEIQESSRSGVGVHHGRDRVLFVVGHGVPHGAELPGDELAEPVASLGCGGQPEPELRGDPFHAVVVRGRAEVVALVDDDVPYPWVRVATSSRLARDGSS
ncbi:MAG TPA: hypothetical protein VFO68_08535, partial [Actinophytocola sp.]